ncbi:MAG TPA: hypothetical protein VMI06_00180 [Terriglobia bacterium]|nr:hypothetical protein [Terriglobia bacterium]
MSRQWTGQAPVGAGLALALLFTIQSTPLAGVRHPSLAADPAASARRRLDNAVALERLGLYKESESEYLGAMTSAKPAVRLEAEAGLARAHAEERRRLAQTDLGLGKAFENAHELDQALAAYESAYRDGGSHERAEALEFVQRVLNARTSFWENYVRAWAWPWLVRLGIVVIGLLVLLVVGYGILRLLRALGGWVGSISRRIEIADFEDTTDTGLGKGFPALLRTVYRERQFLGQLPPAYYGGLVFAPRPRPAHSPPQPVMGSAAYETFSEIDLTLAGIKVSELLNRLERLVKQPRYLIGGVIYRCGDEVHSAVSLTKYNKVEMNRWDFILRREQGAGPMLIDPIYEIIDFILSDWRRNA